MKYFFSAVTVVCMFNKNHFIIVYWQIHSRIRCGNSHFSSYLKWMLVTKGVPVGQDRCHNLEFWPSRLCNQPFLLGINASSGTCMLSILGISIYVSQGINLTWGRFACQSATLCLKAFLRTVPSNWELFETVVALGAGVSKSCFPNVIFSHQIRKFMSIADLASNLEHLVVRQNILVVPGHLTTDFVSPGAWQGAIQLIYQLYHANTWNHKLQCFRTRAIWGLHTDDGNTICQLPASMPRLIISITFQ